MSKDYELIDFDQLEIGMTLLTQMGSQLQEAKVVNLFRPEKLVKLQGVVSGVVTWGPFPDLIKWKTLILSRPIPLPSAAEGFGT